MKQQLIIKGMVCQRCISTVRDQLSSLHIEPKVVELGVVHLENPIHPAEMLSLKKRLDQVGLFVLDDKQDLLVRKVKQLVAEVYSGDFHFPYNFRFSDLVETNVGKPYDQVSKLFSSLENTTIENYIKQYRIDKIKELMAYSKNSLSDIAFRLGYSSTAHLSKQFKDTTGLNPSFFREKKVGNHSFIPTELL
jgi:AraC-like DNA-binding protein